MPTRREREYYRMGFQDGVASTKQRAVAKARGGGLPYEWGPPEQLGIVYKDKPKRKLSAWNKYVKNKRNHITYRDGKLNLKKMAVAFRRKKRR